MRRIFCVAMTAARFPLSPQPRTVREAASIAYDAVVVRQYCRAALPWLVGAVSVLHIGGHFRI